MPIIVTPVFSGAAAAFSYVADSVTEMSSRGTSLSLALPTYQAGDLLVAFLASNGYTVSTPTGWTKRYTPSSNGIHIYTKVAVAGEATPAFVYSASDIQVGCMVSIRGATYVNSTSASDLAFPSCPSVNNGLAIGFAYDYHSGSTARNYTGSGWTELRDTTSAVNDGNGYYNHWGLYRNPTTGTTSPASGTITDSGESLTYLLGVATVGPS